ncbi:MAG: hypothetical protein AAF725_21875 [Acidobacteriota bacterium]
MSRSRHPESRMPTPSSRRVGGAPRVAVLDRPGLDRRAVFLAALVLALLVCLWAARPAAAGAFLFAGEGNGVNVIAHPSGYSGSGGVVEVSLCVDPASPNAADMEVAVQNIAVTMEGLLAATPNLLTGGNNDIPSGRIDFESVALHEVGHCIGLAHPNLGSQTGVTNTNSTNTTNGANDVFNESSGSDSVFGSPDDPRGDDQNLHWFRLADNNPFLLGSTFDTSTYTRDISRLPGGDLFAANADRTVGSAVFGVSSTEAVMQQGSGTDEDQRRLQADDIATLRLGMSGVDRIQGTADDYTIRLNYVGQTNSCDVVLRFDNAATGFANCRVGGSFVGSDHIAITTGTASFNTGFNWHFNDVLLVEGLIFESDFETGNTSDWSGP